MVWLVLALSAALLTGAAVRGLGETTRHAVVAGVIAGAATLVLLLMWLLTALGECAGENSGDAAPWWSARRQFCIDGGSLAAVGAYTLLLVAPAAIMIGTIARRKGWFLTSLCIYALVPAAPLLPILYVSLLPPS